MSVFKTDVGLVKCKLAIPGFNAYCYVFGVSSQTKFGPHLMRLLGA